MADDADRAGATIELMDQFHLSRRPKPVGGVPSDGICRDCKDAIEPERLEANPHARFCACCAEDQEAAQLRARKTRT